MTAARLASVTAVATAVLLAAAAPAGAADEPPVPPAAQAAAPSGARPGPAPGLRRDDAGCGVAGRAAATGTDTVRRMQLDAVHALAEGTGVVVAVIDTGVAPGPAFGARLRGGGDYLTGGDGLDDCDGHGTAVAGLIAARPPATQSTGTQPTGKHAGAVQGIAPGAEILSIRQLSEHFTVTRAGGRTAQPGDTAQLGAAIVLAVREGAKVINISEVSCLPAAAARQTGDVLHAALDVAARADVVVVAAAGNIEAAEAGSCVDPATRPQQVSLPGWYDDDVLTVGAVDDLDAPAAFTVGGPWVDVAAPGVDLRSVGTGGETVGGLAGTSYSAPLVSGLAALVRERYPQLSARQVVDRIVATARRPGGTRTAALGHGVVDPLAALTALPAVLDPDVARPVAVVALAGTASRPTPVDAGFPVDLAVVAAFGAACVFGAQRLRRH